MKFTPLARGFPCLNCDQPVSYERFRSRFCSDDCERAFEEESKTRCQRCGDWKTPKKPKKDSDLLFCTECEKYLFDRKFCCLAGKASYLFKRYTDHYDKKLGTIEWEDEEMSELGYNLRSYIKKALKEKRQIEARLSWLAFKDAAYLRVGLMFDAMLFYFLQEEIVQRQVRANCSIFANHSIMAATSYPSVPRTAPSKVLKLATW